MTSEKNSNTTLAHALYLAAVQTPRVDGDMPTHADITQDGGEAYDQYLTTAAEGGDLATQAALEAVTREDFARTWRGLLIGVAQVAAYLGVTEDDECDREGIDWGTAGPADDAPVFLLPGWSATDGQCAIHFPLAASGSDAAKQYVVDGDYADPDSTYWLTVDYWQSCVSIDASGARIAGRASEGTKTITIDPKEPECPDREGHDWQSPLEIVGGDRHNPGVWGRGAGAIIVEACMRCGCERRTNTWAQNPVNGEQGLTSVSFEPGKYSGDVASLGRK